MSRKLRFSWGQHTIVVTKRPKKDHGSPPASAETKGLTPDQKALLWKQQDNIARRHEAAFGEAAVQAFEQDKRDILALVSIAKGKSKARKATLDYGELLDLILKYLAGESLDTWRKTFQPVIEALIEQQGEMLNAAFGMQFDIENVFATESFRDYLIKFAQQIAQTTNDDITAMLGQAMHEGWSIPKMQTALETMFEKYMNGGDLTDEERAWFETRMPDYRRENIARTETIRSSNLGSTEIYKGWGAWGSEWLATMDDRVRDTHAEANGQIRPFGAPFEVGGEKLLYPGDPNGSAGNVCSCRCTTVPILEPPQS